MLHVSPKDIIRFNRLKDAAEWAAERANSAAIALEEARAAADGSKSKESKESIAAAEKALAEAQAVADAAKEAAANMTAPTYLLKAPDMRTRAALRRDLTSDGVRSVTREGYLAAMRQAVADGYANIPADDLAEFAATFGAGEKMGEALMDRWNKAWAECATSPSMLAAFAEDQHSKFLHAYHAARHVLVGIEGGATYSKAAGITSDATMNAIPEDDLKAISDKAMELFYLPQAAVGN